MLGKSILAWMHEQDRSINYLSRSAGIAPERLIDLLVAAVAPVHDELAALAHVTGLPVEDLSREAEASRQDTPIDPLRCYSVVEAAGLLGVSPDTIRKEMSQGTLAYVVLGERAMRIPRRALEERLARSPDIAHIPVDDPSPPPRAKRAPRRPETRQLPLS